MRHLEDLDPVQCCLLGHSCLRFVLGIAREHDLHVSGVYLQHHTGVVGGKSRRAGRRPQDCHDSAPDPPSLTCRHRAELHLAPGRQATEALANCDESGILDIRDADPSHANNTDESREPPDVVVVVVCEDDRIERAHTEACQGPPQCGRISAHIHQKRGLIVLHEDRIALPDIEHDDAAVRRSSGARPDGKRCKYHRAQEQSRRCARRTWPACPYRSRHQDPHG